MSARLYLTHNERYRVRLSNGDSVSCRWDDPNMRFVIKTMRGDKVIANNAIVAVSPLTAGRNLAWTSLGNCFRDMHKGRQRKERWDSGTAGWRHPYQTAKP